MGGGDLDRLFVVRRGSRARRERCVSERPARRNDERVATRVSELDDSINEGPPRSGRGEILTPLFNIDTSKPSREKVRRRAGAM
jgi:hypothetical protein